MDQLIERETLDHKTFRLRYANLVEDFIDRSQVDVPDTFVPSATGFGVTNCDNLHWVLHRQGMFALWERKWSWIGGVRKHVLRTYRPNSLTVYFLRGYRCALDDYKQLWAIETETVAYGKPEVHNVLALNTTPILFANPKVAKAIAELCEPNPPEQVKDLHWIPITG